MRPDVALARAAHMLRGTAGYFAAGRIFELARSLEDLGRAGDLAEADRTCRDLGDELARLQRLVG